MHSMVQFDSFFRTSLILFLLLTLTGCSTIQDLGESIQKPSINVEDVRVSGFNFQQIDLIYDIHIDNPNAVAIQLNSYDYALDINDHRLIQGDQPENLQLEASGESTFQVPVTLTFSDIYNTVAGIAGEDEASYAFSGNLRFDLPVLGLTELPISYEGTVPLLQLPKLIVQNLQVENISMSRADLNLKMQIDNPNGIGLGINQLNYDLIINGDQWAEGTALQDVHIKEEGVTELNIPLSLNISRMGMSAYRMLTGSQQLDYRLRGNFNMNAMHELLGETNFDFDRSGSVSLAGN